MWFITGGQLPYNVNVKKFPIYRSSLLSRNIITHYMTHNMT